MKEWLLKTAIVIAGVFAPVKAMMATVIVLLVTDMITGMIAARKRKEPITSTGLKRTVVKCLVYETAIMLGFLTEQYLTGNTIPVSNIIASLIGMTELLSVLENLNEISGDGVLKAVVDKLSVLKKRQDEEDKSK